MKFKPSHKKGGMTVELKPRETQLPGAELATPFAIRRILVPVDFSDCSKKALQYATAFAEQFDAKIVLLNVTESFIPTPELSGIDVGLMDSQLREHAAKQLADLEDSLGDTVKTEVASRNGRPYLEIVGAAKELDIDLIILATHGRTGLAHVLMGSTAEKVVQQADCPVLIVREREHEFTKPRVPLQSPPR